MSDATDHQDVHATDDDRYRSYEAADGSLVLYDGDNDHAWVQSDTTVDLRR